MRTVSPRTLLLTVLLGLAGWPLACRDSATEPPLPTNPVTMNPDRAVLATLYEATGGDDWTQNDNWLSAAPIGQWYGVSVGADGRVVGIRLPSNNLSGPIPPELSRLSSLEELSLSSNLSPLRRLALSSNDLSGPIPPELATFLLWCNCTSPLTT